MPRRTPLLLVLVLAYAAVIALARPLEAQSLRDRISHLFIFGSGDDPLFLAGTADPNNPASIQAHASHFVPAAASGNATMIDFVMTAISASVTNVPTGATSGGTTFRFEGGAPVMTSISPGPIFGERSQTLGRGRSLAGVSYNSSHFQTLRGVDLHAIHLNFTHVNSNFPGCDTLLKGPCAQMGFPLLENDVIQFDLNLDVDVSVTSFVYTYGLTDHFDIGVVVPFVSTKLIANSYAQVDPFGSTAAHFFGGTATNPVLSASRFESGSASGLGDVGIRAKVGFGQAGATGFAMLADARIPTGDEEDLLGAGKMSARGLIAMSARFGPFTPHANLGYLYRADTMQNDALLATLGFDHLMSPWATIAMDVVSEMQMGTSTLRMPGPVHITYPFQRTIRQSAIPNRRDDIVNASVGMKLTAAKGLNVVGNTLWPLNRGGLRPNVLWTLGLEYNF